MATRFGAVSPAQAFATKVRWLVACLVLVILTLVGTIAALVGGSENPQVPLGNPTDVVGTVNQSGVDILVAAQRIEEGVQIQDSVLSTLSKPADQIQPGTVLASERPTVVGRYAKRIIFPSVPLTREDFDANPPLNTLPIPPGFRAATITVDRRTGVEGWARPNSRVDVLWTYKEKGGETKVATIVRFTKILSVAGAASNDPNNKAAPAAKDTTVTLLVNEKDAKKIELARSLGTLTLSLVGETVGETPKDPSSDIVTVESILGSTNPTLTVDEEPVSGRMYTTDPRTGRKTLMVLKNGHWKAEKYDSEAESTEE